MTSIHKITAERVRELLNYDPLTEIFTWRCNKGTRARKDDRAGGVRSHYWQIGIDGFVFRAGHLAFLYTYGRHAKGTIDHINRDKLDDRIVNLREATWQENLNNRSMPLGISGYKGIRKTNYGRWRVTICHNYKLINVGSFLSLEEAVTAYKQKQIELNKTMEK